ncbi:MAG TPA: hypothetical protein ENG46_00070 [Acidilobales archaeon]|nr:hypothetical protein [Acidilobales archaeon]
MKLCRNHLRALENILEKYKVWVQAYGSLSWREYLKKISSLNVSGKWVREVAKGILEGIVKVNLQ